MGSMNPRALASVVFSVLLMAVAFVASAAPPQLVLNFNRQLERLEANLQLTPAQKVQYDVTVAATKRAMMQFAMAAMQAKARVEEELAKPRPDLNLLYELRESIVEDGKTLRREARVEWSKLYAMLDNAQVAEVKRFIEERIDRLGLLHDFLLQLILAPRERT